MTPSPLPLSDRLRRHLETGAPLPQVAADDIVERANTRLLACDAERLAVERRIAELAHRAGDPDAAQELRRLWLRHRTVKADVAELRRIAFKADRSGRARGALSSKPA
jgi:hypothetical protein